MAASAAAPQAAARRLVPAGGMWQSIPHQPQVALGSERPKAGSAVSRRAEKAAKAAPAAGPKARPPRHPVAAASVSEEAPRMTAAARTRELSRRLEALSPGTKLGEPMADPENPAWRRPRPGRPGPEGNSLSLPLDEKGQAGFVARGYHVQPDAQNPQGNTGATFGLRTKF